MLRQFTGLRGDAIHASDGDLGKVDEMLFDDAQWTTRYLVINTGRFLSGRKVLIAPIALRNVDWDHRRVSVGLTRDQIEKSPGLGADQPVSRQFESDYYNYYAWPYYWSSIGLNGSMAPYTGLGGPYGALWNPESASASADNGEQPARANAFGWDSDANPVHGDPHLRSSNEVTGYDIVARDGNLGHVEDFIMDADTWRISYLVINTHVWWPGGKVLLPLAFVRSIDWPDRTVTIVLSRDQIRSAPHWNPAKPISTEFEAELAAYFSGIRPESTVRQAGIH